MIHETQVKNMQKYVAYNIKYNSVHKCELYTGYTHVTYNLNFRIAKIV